MTVTSNDSDVISQVTSFSNDLNHLIVISIDVTSISKINGCEIQDVSTSISIVVKFEEMSEEDDGDESDKHLEARDRRYSCLIFVTNQSSFPYFENCGIIVLVLNILIGMRFPNDSSISSVGPNKSLVDVPGG